MSDNKIDLSQYNDMVKAYRKESDRAAAILAAAFLDDLVGQLVRERLLKDTIVSELFNSTGPLATFAARIRLAYGMGLISLRTYRDMDLVRRIRNEFAHTRTTLTFSHPSIIDRCRHLSAVALFRNVLKMEPDDDPRFLYLFTVAEATNAITEPGRELVLISTERRGAGRKWPKQIHERAREVRRGRC
jgi:DNA-binding MltR family transcriptional regulator